MIEVLKVLGLDARMALKNLNLGCFAGGVVSAAAVLPVSSSSSSGDSSCCGTLSIMYFSENF